MNFSNKSRILVLAAHADDETLGCGGTLIRAIKQKSKVKIIFFGEGVSARFDIGYEESSKSLAANKIREREASQALKILKINDYEFGYKHCTKFDKYPISLFVKKIEEVLRTYQPNIIFTHCDKDLNLDHTVVHKATMVACRPSVKSSVKEIYSFEVVCSSNWVYSDKFQPNVYVDIENTISLKQKAFSKYKNESKAFPFPRSRMGLDVLAKFRGMQSGLKFAEAFKMERYIHRD